jgi:hypothetical protein
VIGGQKWLMRRDFGPLPPGIAPLKTPTAVVAKAVRAAHARQA